MMSMSRRVYLGPLSVPASGYGYSSMTSVWAILLRSSRRPCPVVTVPVCCECYALLPVPESRNGNSGIKEIKIQTFAIGKHSNLRRAGFLSDRRKARRLHS